MNAHTPGPWINDDGIISPPDNCDGHVWIADCRSATNAIANARLIAAAPDHAMIAAVLCAGVARWEPYHGPKGEFCIEGFCHSTTMDEFGVPSMTHALRAAIDRALATEEAKR